MVPVNPPTSIVHGSKSSESDLWPAHAMPESSCLESSNPEVTTRMTPCTAPKGITVPPNSRAIACATSSGSPETAMSMS